MSKAFGQTLTQQYQPVSELQCVAFSHFPLTLIPLGINIAINAFNYPLIVSLDE